MLINERSKKNIKILSKKFATKNTYFLYLHSHFCGSSSVGRAPAFQAGCREFEPRLPLKKTSNESLGFFYAKEARSLSRWFGKPRLPLQKNLKL